jgi:RNA polymerase sigma factor (sigma-70 family)
MTAAASAAISDIELLNRHRNGSESAFADLVRRHLDWVYGVARRRVRDAHLADDVAQAVFILLHRKAPQFSADGAMMRWLYRTAQYASDTAARSERRRTAREANYAAGHPETAHVDESPEWKELAPILDRLIGKLPRADREAILLRYYRDLSSSEIAAQMGSTPEAVRKRIERAVEKLRAMAAREGIAMSSAGLAAGLGHFVRLTPPPGLVATSTVAATAPAGSAMATSSASIVKGTITMLVKTKIAIGSVTAAAVILAMGAIYGSVWMFASGEVAGTPAPTTQPAIALNTPAPAAPFDSTSPAPKLAPYSGIRWHGNSPQIEVNKTWYDLLAIDGITVDQLHNGQKFNNDPNWKKHLAEDLVEVMQQMHHQVGTSVDLQVRTLDAAKTTTTLQQVPLTSANRDAVMVWPADNQLYLFADLRWTNGTPQVLIGDTWYELLSVEKETTAHLIAASRTAAGDAWQQHFQQQILDDLRAKNKGIPATTDLLAKTLDTNEDVTITVRVPQPRNLYTLNSVPKAAPLAPFAGRATCPKCWWTTPGTNSRLSMGSPSRKSAPARISTAIGTGKNTSPKTSSKS